MRACGLLLEHIRALVQCARPAASRHSLNAGKPPLGFINTRLYQLMADPSIYAECFVDVGVARLGELWDCDTYSTCTGCDDGGGAGSGFVAVPGWDAQTGFGQPLFAGLLKHLSAD